MGWGGLWEGGDICVPMVHVAVWQKATECCKVIILQLKILKKEEKGEKLSINLKNKQKPQINHPL